MVSFGQMHLALLAALAASSSAASDAAVRQYRGDATGALRAAEAALAFSPDDPVARVTATCAAIEAGDLRRADVVLAPLERRQPAPPRAAVLRRVIERRRGSSRGPLMQDLALAWSDAGRPDVSEADPAVAHASQAPLPAIPTSVALTPGERLLIAPPDGADAQRALAIASVADASPSALVANLQVLGLLGMQPCRPDPTEQRRAVARAMEAAARAAPENGYITVAGWLAGCPKRLDAAGVDLLMNAAKRSEFRYPREQSFREILGVTERIDARNARARAITTWLALDVPLMRLVKLAESVEERALRRAAGRAIGAIGLRMADGDAWLERLQGLTLAQKGSDLSEDEGAKAQARARVESERALYRDWAETKRLMGSLAVRCGVAGVDSG
jgi:hypothetical protein